LTVKQIAEIAGVSQRTVRRIAETQVGFVFEKGKTAHFTEKESIEIMGLLRKQGFIQHVQNADVLRQNADVPVQNNQVDRLDRLESLVEKLLLAVGNMMLSQTTQQLDRKALPAPQLDPRSTIIKLVNEYISRTGTAHKDAYMMLYREFGYRTHCNAVLSAKNRGMKIIDYIDSEGQIEILEAIAREIF